MEADKLKTCAESNCHLRGFSYKTVGDKRLLVFRAKHGHEWHDIVLELPQGVLELKRVESFGDRVEK